MTDVQPLKNKYPVRHTVNITQDMDDRLQQILSKQGRDTSLNDLFRAAIRQYLDDQEDMIGSRRHFSKSLQRRLDVLEFKLIFYLNILIYLVAAIGAELLAYASKTTKPQATINLIRTAIKQAMRDGPDLNRQLGSVIEELTDES